MFSIIKIFSLKKTINELVSESNRLGNKIYELQSQINAVEVHLEFVKKIGNMKIDVTTEKALLIDQERKLKDDKR